MNWQEVKEKYPLAFELLGEWVRDRVTANQQQADVSVDEDGALTYEGNFNERDLFDFFDAKGITCLVYAEPHDEGEPMNWGWDINLMEIPCDEERILSRVEAEAGLFTKAFSILDSQLGGQQP